MPQRAYAFFPWFVLAGTLGITALAWLLTSAQAEAEARTEFNVHAAQLETGIRSRMQAYEQVLHGAEGLFAGSGEISRREWRAYVAAQHLDEHYPGMLALAYAAYLPPGDLAAHERAVRGEGHPNYAVWPAGPRSEYSAIVYIEPFAGRNLRAFGFDMLSEPVRRAAMLRAAATGTAALTGRVRLVQEGDGVQQAGTLLYLPVYRQDAPLDSPARRMQALRGWVYQPFRMDDLMHGLSGAAHRELDIALYDGALAADRRLYPAEPDPHGRPWPRYSSVIPIPLYGQTWRMRVNSTPTFEQRVATGRPAMVAGGGALISLLCFGFTWSLARTRTRALKLAADMTAELSESERRFRDLFENSPMAYQSLDVQGRFIDVNERLCELLGYSREELLGRGADEFWITPMREHFPENFGGFRDRGELNAELQLRRKDGTPITAVAVGRIQRDHNGEFVRSHCVLTDISGRRRMEEDLRQSQARLQQAVTAGGIGLWDWDIENGTVYYSAEYKRQLGYAEDEIPARYAEFADRLHPDDGPAVLQAIEDHHRDPEGHPYRIEFRLRHRSGAYRWIQARGMTQFDADGRPARMLGTHIDVTERHETDESLRLSRVVFESAEEGIMVTDADNRIVMVNPAFTAITGYTEKEVIGNRPGLLSSGHHEPGFFQAMWQSLAEHGSWHGEIANRHKSGKLYLEWLSIHAIVDRHDQVTHRVGIFSDITERKEGEERIRYLAHYDALTGLPNRTLLLYRLQQALAEARRERTRLAVMFLDLDRFKPVNDTYGHEAGDQLLCEVGKRLSGCVRESDTVARLGGDEFVVLLQKLEKEDDATLVARKIIAELERPFALGERTARISTSIGIALYPDHGEEEHALIRLADAAMYRIKGKGAGHFYVHAPDSAASGIPA